MKLKKIILPILCFVLFSSLFFALPKLTFASTLSLSPGGGNIYLKATKSVSVVLNTEGEAVNAVSAYLSYPADKLDVAWVSAGGAFAIQAENSFGGGVIKISRGSFSPVSGRVTVATIAFRGKAEGKAAVGFIGGSGAPRASDSSDSLNLGRSAGGVYTVGGQAPAASAQPGSSVTGGQTQNLEISDLKVSLVATNSATISWKTNIEASSVVDYGLEEGKYFLTAEDSKLTKEHSIKLAGPLLVPGTLFHYQATSRIDDVVVSSKDATFQLPGYLVKVKLTKPDGKPLSDAEVVLYSEPKKGKTDQNGEVVFSDVTPGKHLLLVKSGGVEKSFEVEVKELPSETAAQEFALEANLPQNTPFNNISLLVSSIAGAVFLLVCLALVIYLRRRENKKNITSINNGGGVNQS